MPPINTVGRRVALGCRCVTKLPDGTRLVCVREYGHGFGDHRDRNGRRWPVDDLLDSAIVTMRSL